MVAKRIIPCLDVADGRVVKGVNFVGLRDAGDPVELACRYSASGADELVFLDIAASHQGRATLVDLVRRTADELRLTLSAPARNSSVIPSTVLMPPPTVKGIVTASAVRRTRSTRVARPWWEAAISRNTSSSAPEAL